MDINPKEYEVVDASGAILGRLGSFVAKELVLGKNVAVINAEKAIISGNKRGILNRYKIKVDLKNKMNPEHSPYVSRRPDMFVKRSIRGMLPYRKEKGKEAYRKLRVFMGVPEIFAKSKRVNIKNKDLKLLYVKYITVEEITMLLGYTK